MSISLGGVEANLMQSSAAFGSEYSTSKKKRFNSTIKCGANFVRIP